jgi:hypothetical protein
VGKIGNALAAQAGIRTARNDKSYALNDAPKCALSKQQYFSISFPACSAVLEGLYFFLVIPNHFSGEESAFP